MTYYEYIEINTKYSSAMQSTHVLFFIRNFVKKVGHSPLVS